MRPSPPSPTAVWTLCLGFPQAWGNYKPEQLAPSQELIQTLLLRRVFLRSAGWAALCPPCFSQRNVNFVC